MLTFTQQDGELVTIMAKDIADVKEFPHGQTWVTMSNGAFYQLVESVEEVRRRWQEALDA